MSKELADFAKQFVEKKITADKFVNDFIDLWKQEGANGTILLDSPAMSEMLSTIFCFADLYNPNEDREDYEFDEATLRSRIRSIISI